MVSDEETGKTVLQKLFEEVAPKYDRFLSFEIYFRDMFETNVEKVIYNLKEIELEEHIR